MKKILLFLFPILLIVFSCVSAQDNTKQQSPDVPEGMEAVKITEGYTYIIPKGMQIIRSGASALPEDIKVFIARRLQGIDQRLAVLEADSQENAKKVKDLELRLAHFEKKISELEGSIKELESTTEALKPKVSAVFMRLQKQ